MKLYPFLVLHESQDIYLVYRKILQIIGELHSSLCHIFQQTNDGFSCRIMEITCDAWYFDQRVYNAVFPSLHCFTCHLLLIPAAFL